MSINFPTFVDKEIVTPEKMNAFVQDIEAKFSAGIISTEIMWPLTAGGHLNMGEYDITGAKNIIGIVNASAYATLDLALAAASDKILFLPPGTYVANASALAGTRTAIIGSGAKSIIQVASTPGAYLLRNSSTGGSTNFLFANVRFVGDTGGEGVILQNAYDTMFHNCWFETFDSVALTLTNDGNAGSSCKNIMISGCHFVQGTGPQIFADDIQNLTITGCVFTSGDQQAISITPTANAYAKNISITGNVFDDFDNEAIEVNGNASDTDGNAFGQNCTITGNIIDDCGSSIEGAIRVGSTSNNYYRKFVISDNVLTGIAHTGIAANAGHGTISGNTFDDFAASTGRGIDLYASKYVSVFGNIFYEVVGDVIVDAGAATYCLVCNNFAMTGNAAISRSINPDSGNYIYNNPGNVGVPPPSAMFGTGTGTTMITLPAGMLTTGDMLDIVHHEAINAGGGTEDNQLLLGGKVVGSTAASAETGPRTIHSRIVFTGTTTADYSGMGVVDGGSSDIDSFTGSVTGLDLGASMVIGEDHTGKTSSGHKCTVTIFKALDGG